MPYFVYGRDEQLAKMAVRDLPFGGTVQDIKDCRAIGVMKTEVGPLSAIVLYSHYDEDFKTIRASIVIYNPHSMTRKVWRRLFCYPFIELRCNRLEVVVPLSNEKSLKLVEGLGFVREGVLRRFLGDDDLVVFSLLRNEAERWLNDKSIQNA